MVEANTLLSGLGFENGELASAHSLYNGLTALSQTHHYYHGEKVTIGVLTSLFLTDKSASVLDEVYSFCESVGLPTTLVDIGLTGASADDLRKAAIRSCKEGEFIHHEAAGVSPDLVVYTMLVADQEGRRRKKAIKE